ncbi:Reverse transcriptase [Acanthamoeba castellanii str. Neff]|uniref:Reverse transcriptase n=1 Tax=Acanthamoeba castellanii (strain ATCC 30010 / Neff) TaxID=1257118 RepID=L8HG65_ACACF|nr:Reverse transcriptase [Acanthamoeba castellanii str. Neff]ELR23718.1 Reverse transcriptase [Acanthamoeba castellanii str. Neff]
MFLLVVMMEHLQQLLTLAVILNLEVHQMDVENTFLNATLSVHIYVEQPQGFIDLEWLDHVCLLHKSLYGLHQAPLKWNRMMDRHLRSHHFLPTHTNPCIYMLQESSALVIITVYIDNCVIVTPLKHIERAKMVLHDSFRMKDLGQARSILGMEVMRDREEGALYLRQAGKIMEILHDFGMADAKSIGTPMDPGLILHKLKVTAPGHLGKPYRSVVGRLSYLSQATRPDIAFAVNVLSRHVNGYDQSHWGAVKHLLQYLRATKDLTIKYTTSGSHSQSGGLLPVGYADADWGRDVKTRRSMSGILFTLGGSPIQWGARTQKCVATSTMEAELNAIAETIKEAAHLNRITRELFPHIDATLQLYCNNQSAIVIAKSKPGEHTQRTKHYALKLAFLHESVSKLNVDFKYLPTEVMPADVFTKALGRARVVELRSLINLVEPKIESKGRVV